MTINLRDYQSTLVNEIRKAYSSGKDAPIVVFV